jgi:hypothetical protein
MAILFESESIEEQEFLFLDETITNSGRVVISESFEDVYETSSL